MARGDETAAALRGVEPHPPRALRLGLQGATGLVRAMGRGRYRLADAIGMAAYAVMPVQRRHAIVNHQRLQPGIDRRSARHWARASFRAYARSGIDFIWGCGFDAETTRRHGGVGQGRDVIEAAKAAGRGGVLALTHFGNWDMAANIGHSIGLELSTVMASGGPRAITDLVIWARRECHMEVYEADKAAMGLMRGLRRGRFIAILCDLAGGGPTVPVEYCGGPVEMSIVPAFLARRTGTPIIPAVCSLQPQGYVVSFLDSFTVAPDDTDTDVMQRVASTIERELRRNPEQWYPFSRVYADR